MITAVEYRYYKKLEVIVSSEGDLLSFKGKGKTLRIRKTNPDRLGYIRPIFFGKLTYLHRIIAECFLPNPNNFKEVNHINRNKSDNRVSNLEWCDKRHNMNCVYTDGIKKYGASKDKNRGLWTSAIKIQNRMVHLGRFKNKEDAFDLFYLAYSSHYGVEPWQM